jgi:CRP-like cAMP-binding protein
VLPRTAGLWKRALCRLRTRWVIARVSEEVTNYGTNELLADDMRYKENLDTLLACKIGKNEAFRKYAGTNEPDDASKWLISPDAPVKRLWDVWIMLLMGYTAIILPFRLAFHTQIYWDMWTILELAADISFFADIMLTCCSSYYDDDGELVRSRRKVFSRYLKCWFFIDFFSSLPFTMFDYAFMEHQRSENTSEQLWLPRLYKFIRLGRLARITRISEFGIFAYVQQWLCFNSRTIKLVTFFLIVSIGVHIVACFWFSTWELDSYSPDSWVSRKQWVDKGKWTQYLAAVYWAVTTVVTVGYGDIAASTWLEMAVAVGWMFVGVGFYSFTIGSLSNYLTIVDTREALLTAKLAAAQELALETGISHSVRGKVRAAIRYHALKTGTVWRDRQGLFAHMPMRLQFEIAGSMFNNALKDFPFFTSSNPPFLVHFLPLFKPVHLQDNEVVYLQGDYPEEVLFIAKGRAVFVLSVHDLTYKSYVSKSYFGDVEVLKGINRLDNAKTCGDCEILIVKKRDFLTALEAFPGEIRRIRAVAEERLKRHRAAMLQAYELLSEKLGASKVQELLAREPMLAYSETGTLAPLERFGARLNAIQGKSEEMGRVVEELEQEFKELRDAIKSRKPR